MSYSGGYSRGRDEGRSSSTSMKVESANVGKIIGRGGSKIKELEQASRAKITISREADEDGMKSVDISGSDDDVEKARAMIEQCLSGADFGGGARRGGFGGGRGGGGGGGSSRNGGGFGRRDDGDSWGGRRDREGGDGWGRRDDYDRGSRGGAGGRGGYSDGGDSETIYVEASEVGRIIGRGGSRIKSMEQDSGCKIKVHKEGDSSGRNTVELLGSKSAISEAKRLIQDAGVEIQNGNDDGRGW